ncbi:TldD/PmbA family protein [Desulfobacterales bacterium HSG2]|nr:TldD/PmbA family protein [Desulfobacterales bacterium HSG2]
MLNKNRFPLAEWVMDHTLKNGADEAAVSISDRRGVSVEFRDRKPEQLKESVQSSLGLTIYARHRYSNHSTNDLRKEFLSKFIRNAVEMTGYLTEDEYRSLPSPECYPESPPFKEGGKGDFYADFKLCDSDYHAVESSRRMKIASETEEAALAQSDQIISVSAEYSDMYAESVRIHSNGFSGEARGTVFSASANVTVSDPAGGRPEAGFGANARFCKELLDAEIVGRAAAERALRKIGQKKIASGKYDMIVENRMGGRLISALTGPMSGGALQQRNSFLEGMAGKRIASEKLTMIDDPFIEKGFGSRFFDGEGLAAEKRVMIEKGILRNYYIDTYYGKKLGMAPTSGAASNTVFEYGSKSPQEMIRDIKKGILITGFIGGNSNPTTGDFSFGIVGMLIENGTIVRPVNEMNISGNAREFWKQLIEMGNDPYPYSSVRIPAMFFEGVNFSGI